MKVLVTCPPMIGRFDQCKDQLDGYDITIPEFTQTMSESDLIDIIEVYDGWIAGDDPVTRKVIEKAKHLKFLIKWGIGIDNVDRDALRDHNIHFANTPAMFGNEVADVAIGYLIGITRNLFRIDKEVRKGEWPKPAGISLQEKKVCLVGFGDIGRNIARRLLSLRMDVWVSDPGFHKSDNWIVSKDSNVTIEDELNRVRLDTLEKCLDQAVVTILSCPLMPSTQHLICSETINMMADAGYLINVSRGPIVNEIDVMEGLESGKLKGFATDVFEEEPFSNSDLLRYNVILGSHNASNTVDAVDKTNTRAISLLKVNLEK